MTHTLSLPLQGPRSFAERFFFDFREARFHLNLYGSRPLRLRYGRYLCRSQVGVISPPPRVARFTLYYQMVLSPADARSRALHLEPQVQSRLVDEVECSGRG